MAIKGAKELKLKLSKQKAKLKKASVDVGYTAKYAIYVHENVGANFKAPGTQAKFLEEPLRTEKAQLNKSAKLALKRGGTLAMAVKTAGLMLLRLSLKLCPIDTGNLRGSGYVRESE